MAGRKRSSLTGSDEARELAQRLRDLRDESGLTLRAMAAKSGYSQSALSLAESGRKAPTWNVTATFVQTCGDDPGKWRQLWEITQTPVRAPLPPGGAIATGQATHPGALTQLPATSFPQKRARWQRSAILGTAGLLLTLAAAAAVISQTVTGSRHATPAASPGTVSAARDGTDPYVDGCKANEKQLDWQPVYRKNGSPFGTLILMFSPACQAAWGYLNGPNTTAWTSHIIAHRIPGPASAPAHFSGNAALGSWGNVLSTRTGCVYIEAFITDRRGEGPHARTACFQP